MAFHFPGIHDGDHNMKGNEQVIALLNEVLKAELTAINQYFLHGEMCENWGYLRLAALTRKESIEEMRHAESLIERVLYFDGTPAMNELFPLRIGASVKEQLQNDLQLEYEAVARLNRGIKLCEDVGDNGSRDLLVKILTDEEDHVDFLEAQLHVIGEIGIENYLAQQIEGD
jgi:bacterioferritin